MASGAALAAGAHGACSGVRNSRCSGAFPAGSRSCGSSWPAGGTGTFDEDIPPFQTAAAACSVGASRALEEAAPRQFPEVKLTLFAGFSLFFFLLPGARSLCQPDPLASLLGWPGRGGGPCLETAAP